MNQQDISRSVGKKMSKYLNLQNKGERASRPAKLFKQRKNNVVTLV